MNRLLSLFAICLFHLGLFAQDGKEAEFYTSGYYVQGGETHIAGETKDIIGYMLDESGELTQQTVATLTFGVEGGSDFTEATWDYSINDFSAYLRGNGENGSSEGGTVYAIQANTNGYVTVGVVLNANKPFYILEDGQALADFNGLTVAQQYRGTYTFPVKTGSTYKIYAEGSKLGFYGFTLLYSTDASYVFEAHNMTVSTNVKRNVYTSYSGTSLQVTGNKIWLYAYSYSGYRFKHWLANGGIVSTEQEFYYTMPAHDVDIVAVFEFNPSNPGDPASAENSYKLTLQSQPANVGHFNLPKISKIGAGTTTTVYAYSNRDGFVFQEWQIDGNRISTQPELEFTMPDKNITLTALYKFNPTNPGNPGTNRFDAESGELILDDFTPGNIYNAAWNATGGNMDKVKAITIIGEVSSWDASDVANNCANCTVLDISRTTGMNYVSSYLFNNNTKLTTISLPATVQNIYYGAFYGCTALTTLNIHAVTPPVLDEGVFGYGDQNIAGNVTVFVPASSLSLYQQSDAWQVVQAILPFTSEVCDLEVNFPQGTDIAAYKDMYLEAYNTMSGQRLRYVITNQTVYTFSNIIKNTKWTVCLKNTNGDVLGEIRDIEVKDKNVSVTFESLKALLDVSLAVTTPGGTDVTPEVTITWADKNGNFLTQGATIKNLLEGNVVKYTVALPENLAMQYKLPEAGEHTVSAATSGNLTVVLEPLPQLTIAGAVTDYNKDNAPLQDAVIAVSQTINGQYSKTFVTKTDAEGKWSLTVFNAPTEITASKVGYIEQTQELEVLSETIDPFALKDINGTTINLSLRYKPIEGEETDYADVANVAYTIVNETTGEALTDMSVQYPKIVMMEKYPEGTKFAITASSKNQKFLPVKVTAEVNDKDAANATFVIKQLGGIKASYNESDNTTCVAILYDENGQLVKRYDYVDSHLVINEVPDGTYTLVTMGSSLFFNSVGLLSQFAESGLRNGVDYVRQTATVTSGAYQTILFARVPFFDETKLYYTASSTSFTANKSQVTAGQYLTLRGQVDFKDAYAGQVSNVNLIVDMTPDCEFVANSVMLGKNLTGYTLNGNQLIVPLGNSTEQVRFCVIPTNEGMYEPSASVSFTYNGKNVLQPIGSAQTTVKGVTITVPVTTANPQFTASGTATAKSDVYVYADNMLVGKTVAKANGKWSAQCELGEVADQSEHPVFARIATPQNAGILTDTKMVTFDKNAILAQKVGMSFFNGWMHQTQNVEWNMIEKKVNQSSYMFYNTTDFTFTISFTFNNPETVKDVQLIVYKNDNTYDVLNASFNSKKNIWVASHSYTSWALPTTVKVKYVINGVQMTMSEDSDDEGNEHTNPILDPSGFVYEAVSSNRLQGVTASIYYKEEVEDEYGDTHENVVLWNAEDYAQQNPLFTDENGMYQWDVPNGLWQVRLEKEGYLKTNSEWLPVPPPQLDVNLPMTQMKQPTIINAKAFATGVAFEFDKYMTPATLTAENIIVTKNGTPIDGTIKLQNEEAAYEGAAERYASKVLFEVGKDDELTPSDEIRLTVNKAVESYAGVQMQDNYTQTFVVEPIVRSIRVDADLDLVNIGYGETRTLTIAALPTEAAKGKTINVESLSTLVATVNAEQLQLDENGQAELVVSGELPGSTVIGFTMSDSDVEGQLAVNVKDAKDLKTIEPRASRVSGSKLYRGAKILLTSETENAVIKYTLDGSSPAGDGDNVLTYNANEPIVITEDNVTIKAIALGKDLEPSQEVSFSYELKKSTINYQMATGWTWISHNMESAVATADLASNVVRVVSQTSEVVNDPQYGLVGSLTELQPAVGYKVQVSQPTEKTMQGFEMNANENTVRVESGWNWIGYPLNIQMTIGEALAYFDATAGDMIVGQDGTATYDGTQWQGTLEGMKPGQGYLFKTATTTDIQFNTNTASDAVNQIGQHNWLIGSPWTFDKHAYPNVMPVTAEFYVDGTKTTDDEYVIAAFVGSECRGVGQWKEGRVLMNVFGDGSEDVTFMAYDRTSEQYYTVTEHVTFVADNSGSWFAPMKLTLGNEATGMKQLNSDLLLKVAGNYITVNAGGKYINRLTVTNMGGVAVLTVNDLGTGATITTGSLADGMYIVTIQAEGKTYYEKILKANK